MTGTPTVLPPVVLVALDGSPAALTAMPAARMLAARLGAAVEVLHVVPTDMAPDDARRQCLTGADVPDLTVRVRVGDPAEQILRAAAEPDVALLVLTTHGRTIEPGRDLGHVAEAVVAATMCPILLARPEAAAACADFARLLVPLDGTPTTARALRPATELAERLSASIDLLYVASPGQARPEERGSVGPPRYVDQPQHEWAQWANEAIARLGMYCAEFPSTVPLQMFLAHGDVATEVARFAVEHEDRAIVLVRRSHLEPGRAVHLRALLERAPCPILLVGGTRE